MTPLLAPSLGPKSGVTLVNPAAFRAGESIFWHPAELKRLQPVVGRCLVGGRTVRNLVGRLTGALVGAPGLDLIYTRIWGKFASVSPYFCNWLWGCIIINGAAARRPLPT